MAGRRQSATAPTIASNSLVASAVRYPGKVARIYMGAKEWQREAYRHYGICGEARYAANYFGHSLGRATLHALESALNEAQRLEDGPAVDYLNALFNGAEGQREMLTAIGVHLTIAGECYLIGREVVVEGSPEKDEVWEILAVTEVKKAGETWSITSKDEGEPDVVLSEDATVIRIWRPNPSRRLEADSPFRSLLPVLSEIEWLTLHIFAQCRSRLAGAGILFMSQDVSFPEPPKEIDGRKVNVSNQAEGLLYALAEGMIRPLEDPGDPASLVPLVATVPSEVLKEGKVAELMHFWTDLDEHSQGMRNGAIHRFALGMDLPPEKLLGMSSNSGSGGGTSNGVSHWGAWQVDEDTIKLHVEPMLGLVCNALVIGFLRPLTEGLEAIGYDVTALKLRPDRSKEAIELYNLGLIKAEVVVKENGFNPKTEMMDDKERKVWLLVKIASGSATPEQVAAALSQLGVDVPSSEGQQPRETRPDPSIQDHPVRALPERPAAASLLTHVCEPIVLRALERSGNRLRQAFGKPPLTVRSYETHTVIQANGSSAAMLDDAFSTAAMCLNGVGDPQTVVPVLEAYCVGLLERQEAYSRESLSKALEAVA